MKKRINNNNIFDRIDFCDDSGVVSHSETTGLIPSLAQNDYEIKSYKAIEKYEQTPISRKEPNNNR